MFQHFLHNDIISSNQSGFKPGNSNINQVIAIAHDIFKGFEGVFLDISKAVNKVWHEGPICKLPRNGICGNL